MKNGKVQPVREMEEMAGAVAGSSKQNKMELVPILFKHKTHLGRRKVTLCLCRSSGSNIMQVLT